MFRCISCHAVLWRPRALCEACVPMVAESSHIQFDSLPVWPLYWMVGASHRALIGWKKNRGFLSDRAILRNDRIDSILQKAGPLEASALLIPIPQTFDRSLRLRGSPAQDFTHALGRRSSLAITQALATHSDAPQARRSLVERLGAPSKFSIAGPLPNLAYLVDDFVTTGKTLLDAMGVLENAGTRVLGAFTIGLRPRRIAAPLETEPTPDPRHPTNNEFVHPHY